MPSTMVLAPRETDLLALQVETPEARLSALVAIREDIRRVKGRNKAAAWES